MCGKEKRETLEKKKGCVLRVFYLYFVSLLFWNKTVFYSLWVFQSHHQWFLPSTFDIRASFVRKQKSFGIYLNFQSCQKHILIISQSRFIHTNSLVQKLASLKTKVAHTCYLKVWYYSPHATDAPRKRRQLSHARSIFEPSWAASRASSQLSD